MASWLVAHHLFILFVCVISSSVVRFSKQGAGDSKLLEQSVADNIAKSKRTPSTGLSLPYSHTKDTPIEFNTSLTPVESPSNSTYLSLAAPRVQCDSSRYGQRLNVTSCVEAWGLLPTGIARQTVGERGKGNFDILLPFRVISREYDRTGSSAIQFVSRICLRIFAKMEGRRRSLRH